MSEDREVYIALVLIALIPEVGELARGGAVGAGLTLCLLMTGVGIFGLVSGAWRSRQSRVPRARGPLARGVARPPTRQTR